MTTAGRMCCHRMSAREGGHRRGPVAIMNMPLRLFITSFAPPLPPCQLLRLQAGRPPPRCVAELFHQEGGHKLQAMLDTMLHGDQTTWHKIIRVSSNCIAAARPPSLAAEADLPLGPMQPAFSAQGSQSSPRHMYSECASAWVSVEGQACKLDP